MSVNSGSDIDISGAKWLRASGEPGTHAVEIAELADGHVGMRDGKDPDGPVLIFTPAEWAAFTAGVQDGEFDRPDTV